MVVGAGVQREEGDQLQVDAFTAGVDTSLFPVDAQRSEQRQDRPRPLHHDRFQHGAFCARRGLGHGLRGWRGGGDTDRLQQGSGIRTGQGEHITGSRGRRRGRGLGVVVEDFGEREPGRGLLLRLLRRARCIFRRLLHVPVFWFFRVVCAQEVLLEFGVLGGQGALLLVRVRVLPDLGRGLGLGPRGGGHVGVARGEGEQLDRVSEVAVAQPLQMHRQSGSGKHDQLICALAVERPGAARGQVLGGGGGHHRAGGARQRGERIEQCGDRSGVGDSGVQVLGEDDVRGERAPGVVLQPGGSQGVGADGGQGVALLGGMGGEFGDGLAHVLGAGDAFGSRCFQAGCGGSEGGELKMVRQRGVGEFNGDGLQNVPGQVHVAGEVEDPDVLEVDEDQMSLGVPAERDQGRVGGAGGGEGLGICEVGAGGGAGPQILAAVGGGEGLARGRVGGQVELDARIVENDRFDDG